MPDSNEDPRKHRRPREAVTYTLAYPPTRTQQMKMFVQRHRTQTTAFAASLTGTITSYPLDTIKTRMQGYSKPLLSPSTPSTPDTPSSTPSAASQPGATANTKTNANSYKYSAFDCAKGIWKEEGARGFYRGMMTPLLTIGIVRSLTFSVYQQGKYFFDDRIYDATGRSPLQHVNEPNARPDWSTVVTFGGAGAIAGAASVFVSCPFELTKTAAQLAGEMSKPTAGPVHKLDSEVRKSYKNKGTTQTMIALYRNRGFTGLYCGFQYQMPRDTIGTAVYFTAYENIKMLMSAETGKKPNDNLSVVLAGFCCGVLSWCVCYPFDTKKTQYQKNCLMSHSTRTQKPTAGWKDSALWRGWWVGILRSGVTNAVLFFAFEGLKRHVNDFDIEEQ